MTEARGVPRGWEAAHRGSGAGRAQSQWGPWVRWATAQWGPGSPGLDRGQRAPGKAVGPGPWDETGSDPSKTGSHGRPGVLVSDWGAKGVRVAPRRQG